MIDVDASVPKILPNPRASGLTRLLPRLSVVIPAYNEAARIEPYLAAIRNFLDVENPNDYEVLVVDDGSRDLTADIVTNRASQWPQLRLIQLAQNSGKGAAVRAGVLASRGRRVLFADADGATPIEELRRLEIALENGAHVAAASRYVPGPGVNRERNLRREAASAVFRSAAKLLVGVGVKDTQCGFKLFDSRAAHALFSLAQENGYLFDIEVLALAKWSGFTVKEVAVNWSEIPGSKVRFVRDSLRMFAGLWRLRRRMRTLPAQVRERERRAA